MKKLSKILVSTFTLIMVFSLISTVNVNATGKSDQIIEVNSDSIQTELQSNIRTTFQFREMTQLTICANVHLNLNLNCDAQRIAEKDFILELEGENNLQLTMTCSREENQLGLMDGNLFRVRNRNTYRYLEGFCVSIECVCGCQCQCECICECDCVCQCANECQCGCDCECQCLNECICECDCECQCANECQCICNCEESSCFTQAKLQIRQTNQNRFGKWAYYNENSEEWVTVTTTIEDGYLTTNTDHFSTWTVLVPITVNSGNTTLIIGSTVSIAIISVIMGIYIISFRKRK